MVFVLIVIVAVIVLVAMAKHRKNAGNSWREAAGYLGLKFEGGGGIFERLSITGRLSGFYVDVSTFSRGSGKSSRTYTGYRATWSRSLNMGLNLSRQGFFNGVSSLLGQQDLLVGDPGFDTLVVVKGTNVDRVREFLDRRKRTQILRLQERFSEYEIDDRSVFCCKPGVESETAALVRNVQTIVTIAKTLTSEPETKTEATPVIPPPLPHRPKRADEEETLEERKSAEEVFEVETEEEGKPETAAEPQASEQEPEPVEKAASSLEVPPAEKAPAPPVRNDALSRTARDLFDRGRNRYEIGRHFDNHLKGTEVCGTGHLRRVSTYSNDREFGRGPGAIAEVEICRPEEPLPGIVNVIALVQLPEETNARNLREQIGNEVVICGVLTRCDAFTGKFYLSGGEVAAL